MRHEKKQLWVVLLVAAFALVTLLSESFDFSSDISGHATTALLYCADTDGGLIYTTEGTVSANTKAGKDTKNTDACVDKNNLKEWRCDSSKAAYTVVSCDDVVGTGSYCDAGMCTAAKSCEDSDGGSETENEYAVAGTVTVTEKGTTADYTDYCVDSTGEIVEYYCGGDDTAKYWQKACSSGRVCVDGECIEKTCTDSDEDESENGMQPTIYGTVIVTQGGTIIDSKEDSCTDDKTAVNEAYCSNTDNSAKSMEKTCASGYVCDEGACVEEDIDLKADCEVDKTVAFVDEEVTFDASTSTGNDLSYTWSYTWVDADDVEHITPVVSKVVSSTYTHDFSDAGTYTMKVTVEDRNKDTDSCSVAITVDKNGEAHKTDDTLLFKLASIWVADYEHYDDYVKLTGILEESDYHLESFDITNVYVNDINTIDDVDAYLSFAYAIFEYQFILFEEEIEHLNPEEWLVLQAKVAVNKDYLTSDGSIVMKKTNDCARPLYALTIKDNYYHFLISVDEEDYDLKADTKVNTGWVNLRGVYTGNNIYFYVDDKLEDSTSVSGQIKTSAAKSEALILGGNCDDMHDFHGFLDDVKIWGE